MISPILKMLLLVLSLLLAFESCGKKKEDEEITEDLVSEPPPPATQTPPPKDEPKPQSQDQVVQPVDPVEPVAKIFIASNSQRAISFYEASTGKELGYIDLATYIPAGSITALTFYSKDILFAFVDPGASGEKIIRIDLKDRSVTSLNLNWFQDATNLNATAVFKMIKWSSTKLFVMKGSTSIEGLTYNVDNNYAARLSNPFINTGLTGVATCPLTVVQYGIPLTFNGTTKLLALSSGVNSRLNIYTGIDSTPSCGASVNFVAGAVTASHIPVGAVQMDDGKVYVRYQFTSNPSIIRYDYDGVTLTSPTPVYTDSAMLGLTVVDRELVRLDSDNVLFSNWSQDSIIKLNLTTGAAVPLIRTTFTQDVNAIAVRPD